jgi:hypothetical protein
LETVAGPVRAVALVLASPRGRERSLDGLSGYVAADWARLLGVGLVLASGWLVLADWPPWIRFPSWRAHADRGHACLFYSFP